MRGERVLTDLLHLAELLQQAATLLEGEHALIRFLAATLGVPQRAVRLVRGHSGRSKWVTVEGLDPSEVRRLLLGPPAD
jgi:ATP-dependent exoDNAse (exonuclease V) beta subunit